MYNKRQLIEAAFEELAMPVDQYNIGPAEMQSALRRLDRMMGTWSSVLPLGYLLPTNSDDSSLTQESGLADEANDAVILNLAVALSGHYGKVATLETKVEAKRLYNQLLRTAVQPIPVPMPGTMPMGAGNKPWRGNPPFFPEPAGVLEADATVINT